MLWSMLFVRGVEARRELLFERSLGIVANAAIAVAALAAHCPPPWALVEVQWIVRLLRCRVEGGLQGLCFCRLIITPALVPSVLR